MIKNLIVLFLAFAVYDAVGVAMVYLEYKKRQMYQRGHRNRFVAFVFRCFLSKQNRQENLIPTLRGLSVISWQDVQMRKNNVR